MGSVVLISSLLLFSFRIGETLELRGNMELMMLELCEDFWRLNTNDTKVMMPINVTELNMDSNHTLYDQITTTESQFDMNVICSANSGFQLPDTEKTLLSQIQHYLTGICRLILCILGFIGNTMSIIVLTGKIYTASSTYVYLIALAVSDSLLLVMALILSVNDIFKETMSDNRSVNDFIAYTVPYIPPLLNTFQTISIWLTLGFTVDRYIMICHPFQGVKLCSRKRAIFVVIGIYLLGFVYSLPLFFEKKNVIKQFGDVKIVGVAYTKFGSSQAYLSVVSLWSYLIFIFVVPCVILAVLNLNLILAVRESRRTERRMSLGTVTGQRNDTTVMLVAVVIVFLVCQLPALVSHTIWATNPTQFIHDGVMYQHLLIMLEISNFLVVLNSAINILLYYGFSKKFRKEFAASFCGLCLNQSKMIVSKLTRRFSCHSNDHGDSVFTAKKKHDLEANRKNGNGLLCNKKRRIKQYVGKSKYHSPSNGASPFQRQSTTMTLTTGLSTEALHLTGTDASGKGDSTNSNNNISCMTVSLTSNQISNGDTSPVSHV